MSETLMGIFVLELLALGMTYLWREWRTNTREFREMRRLMMQVQKDRRGDEEK